MSSKLFRLADRLFNQPLLATESLAHSAASYLNSRLLGEVQEYAAINFDKPVGDASSLLKVKDDVAILPIMGGLTHRMSGIDALCSGGLNSYEGLRRAFDEALSDDKIKTIVMHVDSGGGEASGCFELARHIVASRSDKKIIAYVDEFACSAAYALTAAADEVVASPDADVGSIGVIMVHQELTEAFKKNGIGVTVIKAGEFKGTGSPFQALTESSKELLQARINETYKSFVSFVANARDLSEEAVKGTEAQVYSAQEALKLGLIDSIKSQDEFLSYLRGEEPTEVATTQSNSGETMTEQEKQEMEALKAKVAMFEKNEASQKLSEVVAQIGASAEAFNFNAEEAAQAMTEVGLDNPLSKLFMNVLSNATQKLDEVNSNHAAQLSEKETEMAALKSKAGQVLENSNAMEELGNDAEAVELVEPVAKPTASDADLRKQALKAELEKLIK